MASCGKQISDDRFTGRHFCSKCNKSFSSKRRLEGHTKSKHAQENDNASGNKEASYTILTQPRSSSKYRCKICNMVLSSKQRILYHLNRIHGKSQTKRIYKKWKVDEKESIPKSTYFRNRKSLSFGDTAGASNELNDMNNSDNDVSGNIERDSDLSGDTGSDEGNQINTFEEVMPYSSDTLEENVIEVMPFSSDTSSNTDMFDCDPQNVIITNEWSNDELDSENEDFFFTSDEEDSENDSYLSSSDSIYTKKLTQESQLTESEAHAYCKIAFAIKHNLSGDGSKDLRTLLNICTKSSDKNRFELPYEKARYTRVHYCAMCNALFPDNLDMLTCDTADCQNLRYQGGILSQTLPNRQPKASFVLADVERQLKQLLERNGMWESIQFTKQNTTQPTDFISDITDDDCYRDFCKPGEFLENTNHLSAFFNTDGIPLYSSSKVWPIFLAINEIPVSKRFARENLLIAGIWQGKGNPPFIQYLYAFGQQMNNLYTKGIAIHIGSENVTVKVAVVCSTMDLQAKAYVANMSAHNGEYGCCTCEEPGVVVSQGKGHTRCYPYRATHERFPLRTSDDIINNKAPTATKKRRQIGICGMSGLSVMPYFDLVDGLLPDYMHGVLLGVTKSLLSLWFSATNSKKPFFIGNHLDTISYRLKGICPPDYIERLPRDLEKHYTNFKATELQTWLLFYAIPCVHGILPQTYFDHLCLLSEGVYILLSDKISMPDLERAATLLDDFYLNFEEKYGNGACGLNVHNIGGHLSSYVKKWGPVWAWSCFPFEDANAAILQAVHGTGDICVQYLNLKNLEGILSNLELDKCPGPEIKSFLGKMQKCDKKWASTTAMSNCAIAGAMHTVKTEEADEDILATTRAVQTAELRKVLRVEINGQKLYSEQYGRMKRRIYDTVCLSNGKLLQIMYFVVNKDTKIVFAVGKEILLKDECFVNERCKHIMKVTTSDERVVVEVELIAEKVFHIVIDNDRYVCRMPNILERSIFK